VGADATAADDYYECRAEFLKSVVGEEDSVSGELLEDEF
jgi:hypothetical protein